MNEELSDRRHIEMDLREAVARNELSLHYQPIIDLQRNVVTGFEALARWRHPVRGMIPPGTFITVAEDTGLILPLGERMAEPSSHLGQSFAGAVLRSQPLRHHRGHARGLGSRTRLSRDRDH